MWGNGESAPQMGDTAGPTVQGAGWGRDSLEVTGADLDEWMMSAKPQFLNTLNAKREEAQSYIVSFERDPGQARCHLPAILASIKVFPSEGPRVTACK